jgi:hypothetical protein
VFGAGFEPVDVVVARDGGAAVRIHAVRGGDGPPVLLLHVDRTFATAYYHWFFLIQPADLPERLIAGDPGTSCIGRHRIGPLDVWRPLATTPELVTGSVITGAGHFLAEENHTDTLAALQAFLRP